MRRSSLCSLVSLDRLTAAELRPAARRSSLCSPILVAPSGHQQTYTSKARPCAPRCSAPVPPDITTDKQTCTSKARPSMPRCSAPVPPDITTDKQTCTSKARPSTPRCSAPVPPDIATDKQTSTSKARPSAPRCSTPVPPDIATDKQTCTSKARHSVPRKETRVPNIFPLTRGNYAPNRETNAMCNGKIIVTGDWPILEFLTSSTTKTKWSIWFWSRMTIQIGKRIYTN